MNHSYTIARQFAAGHSLSDHPRCKHAHGHDWTISITVTGSPSLSFWMQPVSTDVAVPLDSFVNEIRGKNLNDMIPAGIASTHGLAMYAWERLAMMIPGLVAIEVSTSEERSRVEL